MSARIHPTAIIEDGAVLGAEVEVGAYAYVGRQVTLGDGCVVQHHGTVEGLTLLGTRCEVFPYAVIGGKTHDLKFKGGTPGLRIGARNVFREYVTVHAATNDGEFTVLGDDNVILAYSHIAHDCIVGNHLVMSSQAALAGHVVLGDHVNVAWGVGMHQFCRVGSFAMVGAMSKLVQDVAPFFIADGNPAVIRGFNKIGLERNGFTAEQIDRVKAIYKTLYRSGLNRTQALEQLAARPDADGAEILAVRQFAAASERGLCAGPE
jgi:UDP-N-acetylglucosamine acyltransferase